jgi:hypothetical protein
MKIENKEIKMTQANLEQRTGSEFFRRVWEGTKITLITLSIAAASLGAYLGFAYSEKNRQEKKQKENPPLWHRNTFNITDSENNLVLAVDFMGGVFIAPTKENTDPHYSLEGYKVIQFFDDKDANGNVGSDGRVDTIEILSEDGWHEFVKRRDYVARNVPKVRELFPYFDKIMKDLKDKYAVNIREHLEKQKKYGKKDQKSK